MADFYVQGDDGGEGCGDPPGMGFRKGIRMEVTPEPPLRIDGDPAIMSDESGSDMDTQEPYRDLVDDPDERMTNPTLYLQKFWRKVSPQAPIYHCYRNAAKRSYICTLTLAIPPSGTRTYTSEAALPSKRAAKGAVSEYALHKGILDLAQESMAQTDRIGTDNAPQFRPKPLPRRDERFNIVPILSNQEEETVASARNPVTALNLAVQRYCVETPSQALLYAHESGSSPVGNYRLHGCTLTVRITPDFHEMYRTNVDFTSAKVAKEAATRLALQEGIVTLLKLHNSFTSKICRQLGLPVPLTLEEHDPVEEENSAGTLGQLVQEVTRNPLAMECEYTTAIRDGTELHGAKLRIAVKPDDVRQYEMSPCLKSKKDAKEAVCRLAARSGLKAELEAQRWLLQASTLAINRLGPRQAGFSSLIPPKAGTVQPEGADYLENAVGYLNVSMQAYTGRPDVLVFDFSEIGPMHTLARSINARFGCTLTARLADMRVLRYEVVPEYPTKKAAKESVAKLAVKQGLVEEAKQAKEFSKFGRSPSLGPSSSMSRSGTPSSTAGSHRSDDLFGHILAGPGGYPSVHRAEDAQSSVGGEAASYPYATYANSRPLVPVVQAPITHEALTAPPPYVDTWAAQPSQAGGSGRWASPQPSLSSNPLVARQQYLSQAQPRGDFPASGETSAILSADSSASSRPAERARPFAADVSQHLLPSAQTSAAQTFMTLIEEKAASKIGEGAKADHLSYTCQTSTDGRLYGGTLLLRDPAGKEYAFSTPLSYPNRRLAQEAAAQEAVHEGLLALIDREWSPAAIARRRRETAADGPPSLAREESPEAKVDPFSQPVSYLHQVCQLFLGHGDSERPHYDLTKKEHTTLYGAFLTVKTSPVSIYKTDMIYTGKAAAKDAVSRLALEDDIIGKLKLTMLKALAPKGEFAIDLAHAAQVKQEREEALLAKSAAQAEEQGKDSGSDDELKITLDKPKPPPKPKVSHVAQLEEYCNTTKRPTPQWKLDPSAPDGGGAATASQLSVRIADETFESPKATKKGDQGGKEKLARLVLKHLQKKDGVTTAVTGGTAEQ